MTVRIVTDSACDLTEEEASALDIDVVPLFIRFGEVEYIDGKELSVPDFYKEMSTTEHLPQTAAPAPGCRARLPRAQQPAAPLHRRAQPLQAAAQRGRARGRGTAASCSRPRRGGRCGSRTSPCSR